MCSICFNTQHLTSENAAGIVASLGDPGTRSGDYIDGLIWGGGWSNEIVWFGIDQGLFGNGWDAHQITAIENAVAAYNSVCNINLNYISPDDENVVNLDIIFVTADNDVFVDNFGPGVLGIHEVPDGTDMFEPQGLGADVCIGLYNLSLFSADTDSFDIGGFDYVTLIHELGHGLGLAHPHDTGGNSTIFAGVVSGDYGDNNQNQGIFTTMSYNDGWQTQYLEHNYITEVGYGYQAGPMAFDIAALQILYGANNSYNTGNNIYFLPTVNEQNQNTYWSCIWDAGGTDTISNEGSSIACVIDLNEAPLIGTYAGGYVSWNNNIVGGFTIANNVDIENATGGSGGDFIIGNGLNNTLNGGAGNDNLDGLLGNDILIGGLGDDTYFVNTRFDTVTEASGEGTDTIQSSVTLTIAANVENLILEGAAINGTGNSLANTITGNGENNILSGASGNDTLNGGGGNDTLNGGFGNDVLIGGLGDDIFVFDSLSGTDTLTDFNLSLDKIHFDGGIFTSLFLGIGEGNFVQAAAALDADDYLIYNASNESLYYDADGSGIGEMVHIATLNVDITSHTSFDLVAI